MGRKIISNQAKKTIQNITEDKEFEYDSEDAYEIIDEQKAKEVFEKTYKKIM